MAQDQTTGMFSRPYRFRALAFGASVLCMCTVDASAKIDITPVIEVRQVFSDDLGNRSGGGMTVVNPGVAITVDGQRASAVLDYSYSRRLPWKSGQVGEKNNHSLAARGEMEVVRDLFYMSAGGAITSLNRDLRGPVSLNPDTNSRNQTTVFSGYITPALRHRLGNFADAELSYTLRGLRTTDDDLFAIAPRNGAGLFDFNFDPESDSIGHDASLKIGNGSRSDQFRWTLSGDYSRERRDVLDELFRSKRVVLDGEYAFSRKLAILGSVGYDDTLITADTDYNNSARVTTYDQNGFVWDAGLRVSPSRRTDMSLRVGRRYGATTYNAIGRWKPSEGVTIVASYTDEVDTANRLFTQRLNGISVSRLGFGGRNGRVGVYNVFSVSGADQTRIPLGVMSINNAATLARTGSVSLQLDRERWSGQVTAFVENRKLLSFTPLPGQPPIDPRVLTRKDQSIGVSGSLNRKMSSRSSIYSDFAVMRARFALSNERTDWFYAGGLGYRYNFSERMSGSVQATHSSRTSTVNTFDESENTLTVGLRATF